MGLMGALIACQWLHFASAMLLFGGSSMRAILCRAGCGWNAALDARLSRLLVPGALIALLTAIGWLLLEAANMGGEWSFAMRPAAVSMVLTDTVFGRLWLGRLPLALLVCFVAWFSKRSAFVLVLLSAGLLASLALTGHAVMDTGWLSLVHPLNQALHLLAGGFWLGGLVPLGLFLTAAPRSRADQSGVARALRRFSDGAMIAVLLVLGSGVFNSWMLVGSFSALIWTSFGNALLVKLVLVMAMLGLALFNRFSLLPALALPRDTALPQLQRNVVLEIIVGATVLAAASVLGNLPPAEM